MAGKKSTAEAVPYQVQTLTPVVGGTVRCIAIEPNAFPEHRYAQALYGLVIRCPDGAERTVWVVRDAEGNGAGWADVVRT
jgi:hypothetical protein